MNKHFTGTYVIARIIVGMTTLITINTSGTSYSSTKQYDSQNASKMFIYGLIFKI